MKHNHISNFFKNQNKLIKRLILIANDIALIFLALVSSSLIIEWNYNISNSVFLVIIGVTSFLFYYRGMHDNVIKNIGLQYIYTVMGLILSLFLFYSFIIGVIIQDLLLAKIVFVSGFIAFFLIILSRITAKFLLYENVNIKEKIILYTDYEDISEAVNLAANSINFELVGIINLKKKNKGRLVDNIKIFGIDDFSKLVKKHNIIKLFIISNNNIKDLDKNLFQQIISFPIKVFKIPDLNDIISKKDSFSDLQHLSLEDFISREVDHEIILTEDKAEIIRNKVVLVTGAGGSIGSILAKQVLANKPKLLIIIDNSEFALFKIESELRQINCGIKIVPRLINIVDQNLLNTIFEDFDIDIVYHAAAYKHVNILENEIRSAIINNIIGTNNLLIASHSHEIKKFVMISTDKAATPTTVMGKTKKFCELIVKHFDDKDKNSAFLSVRFGNVFNSSGSVIQIFKNQIKKGEDLTLTDPLVDRFFMSIQEAVKLVIQASQMGKGGEVFVLDMGTPIKILDIAKRMIHLSGNTIKTDSNPSGDIGIIITGLKKGEKMHEILSENPIQNTDNPQIMLSTDDRIVSNIDESMKIIVDAIKDNDIELMKKVLDITVYK
jgi:FlaA1/EpsC-like NDP-sugar epimerase